MKHGLLLFMVHLAGFEPATPWFVAKYSIQMSYRCIRRDVYTAKGDPPQVVFCKGWGEGVSGQE